MTDQKTDRATYDTVLTAKYLGQRTRQPDLPGEKPWEHHAWEITLLRQPDEHLREKGVGSTISFTYNAGLAHEQTKCGKPKPSTTRWVPRPFQTCGHVRCENAGWQPTPPDLYDALTSLKADSTDGEAFEDWCGNFGMETDSRKALDLYLRCQESEVRSRRFFGSDWPKIMEDEDYA